MSCYQTCCRKNLLEILSIGLILAALLASERSISQVNNIEAARALVRTAYEASQKNDLPGAIEKLRLALRLAEKNDLSEVRGYCLNGIAEMMLRQGKAIQARSVLRKVDVNSEHFGPRWIRARTFELMANADLDLDQPEAAQRHLLEGIRLSTTSSEKDSIELSNLYGLRGITQRHLGEYAETISSFEESDRFRPHHATPDVGALQIRTFLGLSYAVLGENLKALSVLRSVVGALDTVTPQQPGIQAIALSFLAYAESNEGSQREALAHDNRALEYARRAFPPNSALMSGFYLGMSDRYSDLGEFAMASDYARRANQILKSKAGAKRSDLAASCLSLASSSFGLGNLTEALRYADQALQIYQSVKRGDHPAVAWLQEVRCRILTKMGRRSEGLKAINRALDLRRRISTSDSRYDILRLLGEKSEVLISMRRFSAADTLLRDIRRNFERSGSQSPYQRAKVESDLAMTTLQLGRPLDALKHISSVDSLARYSNVRSTASREAFVVRYPGLLCEALSIQAQAYLAMITGPQDSLQQLTHALKSLKEAIAVSEGERRTFSQELTRLVHGEERTTLYATATSLALKLEKLTGDRAYRYEALKLSDQRKAWALREELNWQKRWRKSGVPDSVIRTVAALDKQIAHADVAVELGGGGKGPQSSLTLERKEETRLRLETVRDSLLRNLPLETISGTDLSVDSVQESQIRIPSGTAVISYLIDRDASSAFVLTKDSLAVRSLQGSDMLEKWIREFTSSVRTMRVADARRASDHLYRMLFDPVRDLLRGTTHLVIIPEGRLSGLPFEALAREKQRSSSSNAMASDFTQDGFLVRSYDVSYAQSVSSYLKRRIPIDQERLTATATFCGFAPTFAADSGASLSAQPTLAPNVPASRYRSLVFAEQEVHRAAELFLSRGHKATTFIGHEATVANFRPNAEHGSILHIATHSTVNEQRPDLSSLLFATPKDTPTFNPEPLYAGEASAMSISSDLVVLGSCESGAGRFVGTEGMLAISRSFFQAGARNVLYSLWPVGDRQSADIMVEFYRNLLSGESYAESLRAAKLHLVQSEATAFPLKWAGFVLMGR